MKLLVIDDHLPIARIIAKLAEQSGWQALCCSSHEDYLALTGREKINAFLINHDLPGHLAWKIAANLRHHEISLPVIFFADQAGAVDPKLAEALKIRRVLSKPLEITEFHEALNQIVS